MFLYGCTCSLVDDIKYFLQLENFPRYYGEGGTIPPFAPVVEKEWKNYYWREASSAKRTLKWFPSHGYISGERHLFQTYLEQV